MCSVVLYLDIALRLIWRQSYGVYSKNLVVENNQIVYSDGIVKIFLYTKGTVGGSENLQSN